MRTKEWELHGNGGGKKMDAFSQKMYTHALTIITKNSTITCLPESTQGHYCLHEDSKEAM